MARKNRRRGRVNTYNARPRSGLLSSPTVQSLRLYEDRREFHPEGRNRPARSFTRHVHRLRAVTPSKGTRRSRSVVHDVWRGVPHRIGFVRPERVLVCVRRKMRREVIHALKKNGKGGGKKPRLNWRSKIKC